MNTIKFYLCGAAVAFASLSQAVPLVPDAYTALPGIPTIPGTVVQDVISPFSFSAYGGTVSGSVQNRVTLKGDGTYLFEWRVFNDANSAGPIQDLRLVNFVVPAYDGDWESAGLGDTHPTQAYLFGSPHVGDVNFNFSQPTGAYLGAGHSSFFFYLNTTATTYGLVAEYDLTNVGQSQISSLYSTFAPVVPEPASLTMLGLGALALIRRRKNR
jgi:hypothetical protein